MRAKSSLTADRVEAENGRQTDSPGVTVLPPVIYLIFFALGLALDWLWPVDPLPPLPARIVGTVLLVVALTLGGFARASMLRAGTNIRPDRPTTAIVTNGVFRFTRNPLYLSCTAFYMGVTLLVNALWPLVLLVPLLALIRYAVILREERYLENKFGEPYLAYKARVRRWL